MYQQTEEQNCNSNFQFFFVGFFMFLTTQTKATNRKEIKILRRKREF